MVKLSKIYTKGGDDGETSLGGGSRVAKHDPRVAAYGAVDEANATIGLARLHTTGSADDMLARIQNDLFDVGADLARPGGGEGEAESEVLRTVEAQVERLEYEIDAMNENLEPLSSFTLPGGTAASAHLHLSRTVVRRAERQVSKLMAGEAVNPLALRYLNRLSDHLFVLTRHLNDDGNLDVLWVPGDNR